MNKTENFISENWNTLKLATLILTIIGTFIVFDDYVNKRIENKIKDNGYIESLSKSLRPFCVFDEYGAIIYDHGASELIKFISFDKKKDVITVEFYKYMQNAPLLITIGSYQYSYNAKKKNNNIFIYDLSLPSFAELNIEGSKQVESNKYVLEILK